MKKELKTLGLVLASILTMGLSSSCSNDDNEIESKSREAVDLGLPSGTLWAHCNIGASKPEEFGNYYAWGETEVKSIYSEKTYKHCNGSIEGDLTKYCDDKYRGQRDDKKVLDPEDDVAHIKWGEKWRMPTKDDFDELYRNCTWSWTSVNGVYGYEVKSKTNNNYIFLPAARYRDDDEDKGISDLPFGCYWTSTLHRGGCDYAYSMRIYTNDYYPDYDWRACGMTVRAVCK